MVVIIWKEHKRGFTRFIAFDKGERKMTLVREDGRWNITTINRNYSLEDKTNNENDAVRFMERMLNFAHTAEDNTSIPFLRFADDEAGVKFDIWTVR